MLVRVQFLFLFQCSAFAAQFLCRKYTTYLSNFPACGGPIYPYRANLDLVGALYPGYRLRLYYDIPETDAPTKDHLCGLACSSSILDICDINKNPRFGNGRYEYV